MRPGYFFACRRQYCFLGTCEAIEKLVLTDAQQSQHHQQARFTHGLGSLGHKGAGGAGEGGGRLYPTWLRAGLSGFVPLKSPGRMGRGWFGLLLLVMNLTLLHQPYEFNFADGNGQRFSTCMHQLFADEKTSRAVGPNSANHTLAQRSSPALGHPDVDAHGAPPQRPQSPDFLPIHPAFHNFTLHPRRRTSTECWGEHLRKTPLYSRHPR